MNIKLLTNEMTDTLWRYILMIKNMTWNKEKFNAQKESDIDTTLLQWEYFGYTCILYRAIIRDLKNGLLLSVK